MDTVMTTVLEDTELAIFTRRCEDLIADPLRLDAVMHRAGITDEHGRLTNVYGGTQDTATTITTEGRP